MNADNILQLIRIFHAVVPDGQIKADPVEVNRLAMMAGYLVEPEACTVEVFEAMKLALNNYKSTFYKDFQEVLSRTRFDLFVDQMLHYMSTYGTTYHGPAFTLNPTPEAMAYKALTPVRAVSPAGMFSLCMDMLGSGVALRSVTLVPITDYVASYVTTVADATVRDTFSIADIPNREARCMLYVKMRVTPDDPVEFLRVAVFCATGSAMLINSPEALAAIRYKAVLSLPCLGMFGSQLSDERKKALASVYYRYTDIFISFKQSFAAEASLSPKAAKAVSLINYLRRLAPSCKKPFRGDALASILKAGADTDVVRRAVEAEKSTFRLVRIMGYLRMMMSQPHAAQYLVRNGKTYVRDLEGRRAASHMASDAALILPVVEQEVVDRLRSNVAGKTVRFPEDIVLAAPTSEKNFVGNFPFLSSYAISSSAFVGVYWRNEWGTHDFDLSYIGATDGAKIGWNADFRDPAADIIFSGDMTDADPEASEILFFRANVPDGFVFVNRYNGNTGSRFRLFFGKGLPLIPAVTPAPAEDDKKWVSGYDFKVNRMDIKVEAELTSDTTQQMVGFIENGRFRFMTLGLGENAVSSGSRSYPLDTAMAARARSAVDLRDLLLKAGAVEVTDPDVEADIDLRPRSIDRTTIISLFVPKP